MHPQTEKGAKVVVCTIKQGVLPIGAGAGSAFRTASAAQHCDLIAVFRATLTLPSDHLDRCPNATAKDGSL
jgi:hypothetical protein